MACPGQPHVYVETDIEVLSDLEHIRRHPGMYVDYTDARGLHSLLFNLVTESLSETVARRGRSVRVALRADGSAEAADDGRPMDNVQFAFDRIGHSHGRWGAADPTGRDTWAYAVANALSEQLTVVARTDGSTDSHSFRRGVTHAVLQSGRPPTVSGLTVTFRPDPDIFGDAQFDVAEVRDRLRQLAFLHGGVRITFTDEAGTRDEWEYTDGIRECVTFLNEGRRPLHDALILRGEELGVRYEVGLQWCAEADEVRRSFANHYRTASGGTHELGALTGAATGLLDFIQTHAPESAELTPDDRRVGLTAVVSVWLREPMFMGATRSQLGNPEVEAVVKAAARRGVCDYFEAYCDAAERVAKAVVAARDMREARLAERRAK